MSFGPGKLFILSGVLASLVSGASGATASLRPSKDNTVFSENTSNSHGAGSGIFAGRAGIGASGGTRRGLVAFNLVGTVPSGSTVTNVTVQLMCTQTIAADQTVSLHRVTANWGEGTSAGTGEGGAGAPATTNDATWTNRMHPSTAWTTPGGDFTATASATQTVGAEGAVYTWGSTPQLIADVQAWVDNPANNFGWLIKGNEAVTLTAKRFGSKEATAVSGPDPRPLLTITYTPPSGISDWSMY